MVTTTAWSNRTSPAVARFEAIGSATFDGVRVNSTRQRVVPGFHWWRRVCAARAFIQFSFLGKKFSLWLVDGGNPLNNFLTKKGYAHTPGARGCVKNLVHNHVRNLGCVRNLSALFDVILNESACLNVRKVVIKKKVCTARTCR